MKHVTQRKKNELINNTFIFYFYIIITFAMSYTLMNSHLKTSIFYSLIIFLAVGFSALAEINKKNIFIYFSALFLSFFTLFFIYAFRNFSAIDDPAYLRIFESVAQMGWFEYFKYSTMEPGYLLLNSIVSLFTDNYFYLQLLTSFIPVFLFYYGFHQYKNIISLPMAVFLLCSMLYFQMLAVALVRMFIAISIIFVAFKYIPEQEPIKYILSVIIAALFHYSSFIMIVLVYFAFNKNKLSKNMKKIYFMLFIISPIVFISIGRFLVPILGSRYQNYGEIGSINLHFSSFTTLPLIMILLLFHNKFSGKTQLYFKLFVFIYALSIIISLFGDLIGIGRIIFYSYSAFILGTSMASKKMKFNSKKIIFSLTILLYGLIYIYYTQFLNDHHFPNLFPYENLFFTI